MKKIREEFIKLAGFTDEDVVQIDRELLASKQKNEESKVVEDDPVIIKKIDVSTHQKPEPEPEPELELEHNKKLVINHEDESEEEQILNSVITRLNEM